MKKEILVIVNPCAGRGKINKYIPQICDNLEKQGFELEVIYTSENNNGEQIIQNYIRYIDTVVVCGGDGTLNEVINGIIKCNKTKKTAPPIIMILSHINGVIIIVIEIPIKTDIIVDIINF